MSAADRLSAWLYDQERPHGYEPGSVSFAHDLREVLNEHGRALKMLDTVVGNYRDAKRLTDILGDTDGTGHNRL